MSYSEACCNKPAVVSDYEPVGTIENLGDLRVYSVGAKDAKVTILVLYDIFGFHNNTKQFCDILSKQSGWRVVMPDYFRGKSLVSAIGLVLKNKIQSWFGGDGKYEKVEADTRRVLEQIQKDGSEKGAFVGFCWGSKPAIQLNAELKDFFVCSSMIHASLFDNQDVQKAETPLLYINSKDEPDMTEYFNILKSKPIGDKCKLVVFEDMHHGFCAARGDFKNEANVKRANEAIQLTIDFFNEHLK